MAIVWYVRKRLNSYFESYPDERKQELKTTINKDFNAGYLELLNHQIFHNLEFNIQVHPKLDCTDRSPDFLLTKEEQSFYLKYEKFEN